MRFSPTLQDKHARLLPPMLPRYVVYQPVNQKHPTADYKSLTTTTLHLIYWHCTVSTLPYLVVKAAYHRPGQFTMSLLQRDQIFFVHCQRTTGTRESFSDFKSNAHERH